MFTSLYMVWAHSEPALVALVFLAGCYNHALQLVETISNQETSVDFLVEMDRLVQIIESPIFACKYIYTIFIERATNSGFWWLEINYPNKMFLQIQWR